MVNAYYNGFRHSGIAKVHIIRTTPVNRNRYRSSPVREGDQAWCGVSAHDTKASQKVPVDPAQPLEPGLSWCGLCIGRAAEHAGLLADVVAMLSSSTPARSPSPNSASKAMDMYREASEVDANRSSGPALGFSNEKRWTPDHRHAKPNGDFGQVQA